MNPWFQVVAGNIAVATLIGCLAWQVGRSGHRARLAHLLWVAFFVKLITPPLVLLPISVPEHWLPETAASVTESFPYRGLGTFPIDQTTAGVSDSIASGSASTIAISVDPEPALHSVDVWTLIAAVWVVGFVVVLTRGLIRFVRFHRLLQRAGTYDEEASAFVHGLLSASESRGRAQDRGPRVLRIPIRVSPMLFGFGSRPAIVCPDQLWQSLSTEDRHAFLAHETAHYCRRDHWVRWLEWIVTAVYWWFPGVYVARNQLERHEEACCDAWAVRQLGSQPRQYAEALLRVVDFVSEYRAPIPRLASGMQPTDSLEERLTLLMRRSDPDGGSSTVRFCAGAACMSLWLVHPIPLPVQPLAVADVSSPQAGAPVVVETVLKPAIGARMIEENLPDPPSGFWNQAPISRWANFTLRLPGARLIAEAASGISIEVPNRDPLHFSSDELTAIVEIPATMRVVIGDRLGQVKLWDLSAGMPVSLIGQHAAAVSSLAYHPQVGLVTADRQGSVMRWDLQSGRVLAAWSAESQSASASEPPSIQSVRYSRDGDLLAILTGQWKDAAGSQRLYLVDSRTLDVVSSFDVVVPLDGGPGVAVVVQTPEDGWVAVDWSGVVRSIESQETVTTLEKRYVSALVLSHTSRRLSVDPN